MQEYTICITCNKEKELSPDFFYKDKRRKSGFNNECKECSIKRTIRNRSKKIKNDPEYKKEYNDRERTRMAEKRKCPEFREKDIESKRKFYWENKEKINKKWKKYYHENREMLINKNRELMSERREILSTFTSDQWEDAKNYFDNKCAYCNTGETELTRDHVIPISKGGYNVRSNIVPACKSCNSSKRDKDMEIWFKSHKFYDKERLKKVYNWTKLKERNGQMALF